MPGPGERLQTGSDSGAIVQRCGLEEGLSTRRNPDSLWALSWPRGLIILHLARWFQCPEPFPDAQNKYLNLKC